MQYPFLENFPRRMRMVAMFYHLLSNNSSNWKEYGYSEKYEQINLLVSIYIFIVERHFTDNFCTSEEVAIFLRDISIRYFHKDIDYNNSMRFTEFILDTVLSDNGKITKFTVYDYQKEQYIQIPITLIKNGYKDERGEISTYEPTDDGIEMLMRTLDIDEEMSLTMSQLIVKKSLSRKNYTSALDEAKRIFSIISQQISKNNKALDNARAGTSAYSGADFSTQYNENLTIIIESQEKLKELKNIVNEHVRAIMNADVDRTTLDEKAEYNIGMLEEIKRYLAKSISLIQDVLSGSMNLAQLLIERLQKGFFWQSPRFSLKHDYFDLLLSGKFRAEVMEHFFHPLFLKKPDKIFNPEKVLVACHRSEEKSKPVLLESDEISDEAWQQKLDEDRQVLYSRYENCLLVILECACRTGQITLAEIWQQISASVEDRERFLSDIDSLKAVITELVKAETVDIENDAQEIDDKSILLGPLQTICQKYPKWRGLKQISTRKVDDEEVSLLSQDGLFRLTVTNICFRIVLENGNV